MDLIYELLMELEKIGFILCDFFNFYDSYLLKFVYVRLNLFVVVNFIDWVWLEVEYDFNVLFVGSGKLLVVFFVLVYLEEDVLVMGKVMLEIWDFMVVLGLLVNQESNIFDDYIFCVLELIILLLVNIW